MAHTFKRWPVPGEIIAVLVIVAVVAAILFPVFAKAHRHRPWPNYSCASNVRQLSIALLQYQQDYDGRWPGGSDHWAGAIYPYVKGPAPYECPDDGRDPNPPRYYCSYAMNANLPGHKRTALSDPSETVAITEYDGTPEFDFTKLDRVSAYTDGVETNSAWGGVRMGTGDEVVTPPRHYPSAMFASCDGHVHLLRPSQVSSGQDNSSAIGRQDAVHAAGTKALGASYALTFSER